MEFLKWDKTISLTEWKRRVRGAIKQAYRDGRLTQKEIEACEAKGIDFRDKQTIADETWINNLEEAKLLNFIGSKNYSKISGWIRSQRKTFKKGKLVDWKVDMLNEASFIWEIKLKNYDEYLNELKEFYKNNNRNPSSNSKDKTEKTIGNWRIAHSKELEELGLFRRGNTTERNFNEWVEDLKAFRKEFNRDPKGGAETQRERSLNSWKGGRGGDRLRKLNLFYFYRPKPKTFDEVLIEFKSFFKKEDRLPNRRNPEEIIFVNWIRKYRKKLLEMGVLEEDKRFITNLKRYKSFRKRYKRNPSSKTGTAFEQALGNWRFGTGKKELKELGIYDISIEWGIPRKKMQSFDERLVELQEFREKMNRNPTNKSSNDAVENSLGKWRFEKAKILKEMGIYKFGKTDNELLFEENLERLKKFRVIHNRNPRQIRNKSKTKITKSEGCLANWRFKNRNKLKELGIYKYKKED